MDLNRIALWIAGVSALMLFWRSARSAPRPFDWLLVSGVVLAVCALGWAAFPDSVGIVSMALTLVTISLPTRLSNGAALAASRQRYERARRLAALAVALHPSRRWRALAKLYRALALAQTGQLSEADAQLQLLSREPGELASVATGQRLALSNRWRDLKEFAEHKGLHALQTQPNLLHLYLRALGELGLVDHLARFLRAQGRGPANSQCHPFIFLFAFAGEPALTNRILAAKGCTLSADASDYWRAVAAQSAGNPEEARRLFGRLRQSTEALVRARAEARFAQLERAEPELPPSPATREIVRQVGLMLSQEPPSGPADLRGGGRAPLTFTITGLCVLVYLLGSAPNFLETRDAFAEKWAFIAPLILRGESWRIVSYFFIHQNWLHLTMNALGLVVLGPFIERAFGRLRFLVIYFVAGCAGSLVYLALSFVQSDVITLVGASGCIMGLLGAYAAVMLRAWLKQRGTLAREFFLRLLAIIALQMVFDYTTPGIAGLAHGAGLVAGFFCALCLRDNVSTPRLSVVPKN